MASDALADELGPAAAAGAEAPSGIDELDPSLVEGHRSYYEREVPFEIRAGSGVDSDADGAGAVGSLEAVRVKILILGDEGATTRARESAQACVRSRLHTCGRVDKCARACCWCLAHPRREAGPGSRTHFARQLPRAPARRASG